MDEQSGPTVQAAVIERLDYLDKLATCGDHSSRAALATTEITRLTGAWRSLLGQHAPDSNGRCPQCSGRWRWRWQRRRPCTIWRTAHEHLVADTQAEAPVRLWTIGAKLFGPARPTARTARLGAPLDG